MKYVGAIDQGTTSTRFILYDREANIVASSQREHRQYFPAPSWVEHDTTEIWRNTCAVIEDTLRRSGVSPADIAALGVTNQRETIVVWDRVTGEPLHKALVWQDARTADYVSTLDSERLRELTGLPAATYFSASKLRWLLREVPDIADAVRQGRALAGTMDSWLTWKLTGVHATDVTNAGRTQLMDLRALDWSDELLHLFGIPREILPAIHPSSSAESFGHTMPGGPLGEGVPLTALAGDQQAALFGQACFEAGEAKCTYGTGAFLLMHTGDEPVVSRHGLLTTPACQIEGRPAEYALEGSVAIAGSLVQWLRDSLGLIAGSDEIEALASSVPDAGGAVFVPAFSGLFAPYWDSSARGVIVGLTHHTGRAHIARAALEATAMQAADVFAAMCADTGLDLDSLRVDGGMTANSLLMQHQADILDAPVVRPVHTETTALGAAFAAGLAVGFWNDLDSLRSLWREDTRWKPQMSPVERERRIGRWRLAIARSRGLA